MNFYKEKLAFRPMMENDLSEVNRIYNEAIALRTATAHTEPLPLSYHQDWYEAHRRENNPVITATYEGKLIGWNALSHYRKGRKALDHVRETSYYIDEKFWGRGVASQLMEKIIEESRHLGISVLLTFIMGANPVSVRLMEKFGFELWGRLPGIIAMDPHNYDHLIFGKRL